MSIPAALIPNARECRIMWARLVAASSAFDGTQPVLRHSPPIVPRSISTVGTPKAAAAAATDRPAAPPPMTQMSGVSTSAMPPSMCPRTIRRVVLGPRSGTHAFDRHRHQRQDPKRGQGANELPRQNVAGVEGKTAIGSAGGKALSVSVALRHHHAVEAGPRQSVDE